MKRLASAGSRSESMAPGWVAADNRDHVMAIHEGGKLQTAVTVALETPDDMSAAYTPGVAEVCQAIASDRALARRYTWVANTVAIVSDGSAVLGLGNIGPDAAMPVMEGKAILFKEFGAIDGIPICLNTQDVDQIVETVAMLAPSFGGINLEDISAPRCFEIERRLQQRLEIPVFHDDQHGTAVVVLAALNNALRLSQRTPAGTRIVVGGAGAAGIAITKMLHEAGFGDIIVADRKGVLHPDRPDLTGMKRAVAAMTAPESAGSLGDALVGADVYIGVSGGTVPEAHIARMAADPIVFALANPTPEVMPAVARRYSRIVATGRSDFPNQINNVLAFPGIFRGALDINASSITESMKLAAASALADLVGDDLAEDMIIPSVFDPRVGPAVAAAVAQAAIAAGVARE